MIRLLSYYSFESTMVMVFITKLFIYILRYFKFIRLFVLYYEIYMFGGECYKIFRMDLVTTHAMNSIKTIETTIINKLFVLLFVSSNYIEVCNFSFSSFTRLYLCHEFWIYFYLLLEFIFFIFEFGFICTFLR